MFRKDQNIRLQKAPVLVFLILLLISIASLTGQGWAAGLKGKKAEDPSTAAVISPVFKTLQWKANVIVITGDYKDPLAEDQLALLRGRLDDLKRNDVAVLRFVRDRISELQEFSNFQYRGWYEMNANQQRFMEEKIQADNDVFSVVLVGKDGAVKRVWTPLPEAPQTVSMDTIFSAIE